MKDSGFLKFIDSASFYKLGFQRAFALLWVFVSEEFLVNIRIRSLVLGPHPQLCTF